MEGDNNSLSALENVHVCWGVTWQFRSQFLTSFVSVFEQEQQVQEDNAREW